MLLVETGIFYLLLGASTAVAVFVRSRQQSTIGAMTQALAASMFWPIFVPMLLSRTSPAVPEPPLRTERPRNTVVRDPLATAIAQVEAELETALGGMDGWAEDVLSNEQRRLEELRSAWKAQAERIRQLDRLLAEPNSQTDTLAEAAGNNPRARHSAELRHNNIRQLAALRDQLHGDLIGTLAWVRELVTMIHLAKFSGAPAARGEELVAQIAAAVEGLSEVSAWRDEEQVNAATR